MGREVGKGEDFFFFFSHPHPSIMEIVTYPNNPTGDFHKPTYADAFHVYDSVYLWPSLVNYSEPLDVDVVLFSMSKATGHAGTRFGWVCL